LIIFLRANTAEGTEPLSPLKAHPLRGEHRRKRRRVAKPQNNDCRLEEIEEHNCSG